MESLATARSGGTGSSDSSRSRIKGNYWKDMVGRYEKRNASLECRQTQLSDRLRALECTLPTVLMNAMVSMHYGTEPPKIDLESVLSVAGIPVCPCPPCRSPGCADDVQNHGDKDGMEVELVYKRRGNGLDSKQQVNGRVNFKEHSIGDVANSGYPKKTTSAGNARSGTGDDEIATTHPSYGIDEDLDQLSCPKACADYPPSCKRPPSAESDGEAIMSSHDLIALGRIQELAEQERLLKKYISDLENRERTFHQTLHKANRLLNDPLECLECTPACPGAAVKEPLSKDPLMQRLQKLEFYNKKMLLGMKNLREEKNVLRKQTELLKCQLRNTQQKLGEVQKEVLGEDRVIPVMGEPSMTSDVGDKCSCCSTSNKDGEKLPDPNTLKDLAQQFEDVLKKAQNHGLCNLTGPIRETAMKLKQLSKSSDENKCICDCPCDPESTANKRR